jgi:hypothetical protein
MIRTAVIAGVLSACGVAETGLLSTVPASFTDGGVAPGDLLVQVREDFGRAPVGVTFRTPLELINTGRGVAIVELVAVDGDLMLFAVEGLAVGSTLQVEAGSTVSLPVHFDARRGAKSATFRFNTCAGRGSCIVERTVRGFGVVDPFVCRPADLGGTSLGGCIETAMECVNDTDYTLFVDGFTISGSPGFTVTPSRSGPIDPHRILTVSVRLCPVEVGVHEAVLTISASLPEGRVLTMVPIRGEGLGEGDGLDCEPRDVEIPPVQIGELVYTTIVCRASRSTQILSVRLRPDLTPGLTVRLFVDGTLPSLPVAVDPMSTIEVELEFLAMVEGSWRDNVEVEHFEGIERIEVRSSAFAQCQLDFPPLVDFGNVSIGAQLSSVLFITNLGTGLCNVETLGITPTSDPAFQVLQPPPMSTSSLQPGEQLVVDIQFAPTRAGPHAGEYRFFSMERGERLQIDLLGQGVDGSPSRYSVTSIPNVPLVPAAGGAPLTFTNYDDGIAQVPLAFPFQFAGVPVVEAVVSTNGLIAFGGGGGLQSLVNTAIPSVNDPNAFIAWWWDDLEVAATSSVRSSVVGVAPARVQTFTFVDVELFADNTTRVTAEVRLYEQGSRIEVHYGAIRSGGTDFAASAGWESFGGIDGADVFACSPSCSSMHWPIDTVLRYTPSP